MRERGAGETAVEAEIQPVVLFVALAPPEKALGIVEDACAIAEFDELEEIVDVGAREENGVGEVHSQRCRRIVGDDHIAAKKSSAAAGIEKAGAARASETENAADDVGRTRGNISDHGALAAAGGPVCSRAWFGEIALARLKNDADLVHSCGDAACGRCGATTRCSESTGCGSEGEMCGVWNGGDRESSVVARDADAGSSDKLAHNEAVRRGSLNRSGGGCGCAASGGGKSGSAGDVSDLRGRRYGNNRKCTVVATNADSCDGDGLSGGDAVRGGGGDGDEETVFGGAVWTGGDRDGGGLRRAVGARDDRDDDVFVDDGGAGSGAALTDAIEIRVVELPREIVAGFAVADGEVFAAEKRGGIGVGVCGKATGHARESAWRGFFVEDAAGVERERAQGGV